METHSSNFKLVQRKLITKPTTGIISNSSARSSHCNFSVPMIGIDCRLTKLDLVLEHKKVIAVHVKYGPLERCCLGVGSSASQYGTFLVAADEHTTSLVKGDFEIAIMSRSASLLGCGRVTSCELTTDAVPHAICNPTFQYIMGGNAEIPIVHKTIGKPDILLGTAHVSICVYQLMLKKGCRCEQQAQLAAERLVTCAFNIYISHMVNNDLYVYPCSTSERGALPDTDFSETSLDDENVSDSDSSLDNFLARFNAKTAQQQTTPTKHKYSSATQTQFPNVRTSFAKKTLTVSKKFHGADVVAVMAPTHLGHAASSVQHRSASSSNQQRQQGPAVNNYAFIDAPPARVTLLPRQRVKSVTASEAGDNVVVVAGSGGTRAGSGPTSAPVNSRSSTNQKPPPGTVSSRKMKIPVPKRNAEVKVKEKVKVVQPAVKPTSADTARDKSTPPRARNSAHVPRKPAWF